MFVEGNEILFIYNSELQEDRKALGYALALQKHTVKEFDVQKEKLTPTQLEMIIDSLKLEDTEDLMDHNSTIYKEEYAAVKLDREDVVKTLAKRPQLIKTPLVILKEGTKFLGSGYDLIRDDMVNKKRKDE